MRTHLRNDLSGVVYVAFVIDVFSRRIIGGKAKTTMKTTVLDTLEMALSARDRPACPSARCWIHHHDASAITPASPSPGARRGPRYASVGSVGDGYDKSLAETTINLLTTEKIHEGPWDTLADVELANPPMRRLVPTRPPSVTCR